MTGTPERHTTLRFVWVSRGRLLSVGEISLLFALLVACAADHPLVERFEQGRRLIVEGTVEIDPQATLVDRRWAEDGETIDGSRARSGVLSSAAIDFFRGQGGRPSLGGQFTLSTEGGPPSTRGS